MNSSIAKQRLSEVIRIDTITSSQGDFLATHVPMKKLQLLKKYDYSTVSSSDKTFTEEEIYKNVVLNPKNKHQFVLVIGSSGAGKSHLIRWFDAKLEKTQPDNEVVLFVRRSDNSLKGTIKQLLGKEEIAQIPNKEIYERLIRATSNIDEKKLKDMIYQNFIIEIKNDDGNGNEEIKLSNVDKKRLISLLQNDSFQARIMKDNGAIDKIYLKVAENNTKDSRDVIALFEPEDFYVDIEFCDDLLEVADRNAIKMADAILEDPEKAKDIAAYMNKYIDVVIQRCAGLEPGDFEQVFIEIRKELKRQGKNLTLLIEDVTAFTGVNIALLNVLTTEHTGMYEEEELCRISAIIGTTEGYYGKNFKDNHKDRVTQFIVIPDNMFGENTEDLCEFVGRYLNAMSLEKDEIDIWASKGALPEELPVHQIKEGASWDYIKCGDGTLLNLFPFTKKAIIYLYNNMLQDNYKTPRYLLRDVVEKTVRDALWNFENFPSYKINNVNSSQKLMNRLKMYNFDADMLERMYKFMCVWGNGLDEEYTQNGVKYIAGIAIGIYEDMNLPVISANRVSGYDGSAAKKTSTSKGTDIKSMHQSHKEKKDAIALARYNESLQLLENWVAGSTINVGPTTGNVVLLTNAREDMCNYLYSAINWQAEGVSMDNITKIKMVKSVLVGFDRQKRAEDAMFYKLPANRETQEVIEAFLAWNVLGTKSWNFDGADLMVYRVQVWTEKIKKPLIEAVNTFENNRVDYFKCAMMAETYRIILFGLYKFSTLGGIKTTHLLENNLRKNSENSHCSDWNYLLDIITRVDADKTNKENVIQYFNLIQGDRKSSQVFLDRVEFDKVFREIKNDNLQMKEIDLQLFDPVRPRRDSREYLQKILERIDKVVEGEIKKANELMVVISKGFGCDDIDEEDIQDLVEKIVEFYDETNNSQVNIKYDAALIDSVRKFAKSISTAISEIKDAQKTESKIDCLILFSQDPIRKVERLTQLLSKVAADVDAVKIEMEDRRKKLGGSVAGEKSSEKFRDEKQTLLEIKNILSGIGVM